MTKRPPPPAKHRFQPGKSGNPGGKPKVPDDIAKARKLNQQELERVVNKYLWLDRAALQEAVKDPATPMLELMVASIMAQAAQKGDQQRLEFILQRLIGRVTDKIEVKVPAPFVIKRASGDELVLGARVMSEDEV